MPDLNKVMLMGRLTADPELRQIGGGTSVTELRMAVNKRYKDKNGEQKEEVLFADVTLWAKSAEIACQYLAKGSNVYVEGSLKLETWDDKTTGEKRSKMKIVGESFQFLDRKSDGDSNGGGNRSQGQGNRSQQPQAARGGPPAGRGGYSGAPGQGQRPPVTQAEVDRDDSIPF
jgi:single-strand DNA-binding protein